MHSDYLFNTTYTTTDRPLSLHQICYSIYWPTHLLSNTFTEQRIYLPTQMSLRLLLTGKASNVTVLLSQMHDCCYYYATHFRLAFTIFDSFKYNRLRHPIRRSIHWSWLFVGYCYIAWTPTAAILIRVHWVYALPTYLCKVRHNWFRKGCVHLSKANCRGLKWLGRCTTNPMQTIMLCTSHKLQGIDSNIKHCLPVNLLNPSLITE